VAEVETSEEPEWGTRRDDKGTSGIGPLEDGRRVRVVVREQGLGRLPGRTAPGRGPRLAHHHGANRAGPLDARLDALRDTMTELLSMDEPRRRFAGMMSGLDIHYDLGDGHPLLGRRMPDLDLRPVPLGGPGSADRR
jgi:hypothetical protein